MSADPAIDSLLVRTLDRIPALASFAGRSTLLSGLPPVALNRDEGNRLLDLRLIVQGLQQLGRLNDRGGARPLIIVVDNALPYVPAGGELALALEDVRRRLAAHYGGDVQPGLAAAPPPAEEALIFGRQGDTRLPFRFLEGALRAARGVGRLSVPRIVGGVRRGAEALYGTGWLIAPGLLITNYHVVEARDRRPPPWGRGEPRADPADVAAQAAQLTARFDYYEERLPDDLLAPTYAECGGGHILASDQRLDYAIVELADAGPLAGRVPLSLLPEAPDLVRGSRLNIAQHPGGGPLQLAIRNNFFIEPADDPAFIRYQTDTEPGASGSPVCNDRWEVVALHHASVVVPSQRPPQELIDGPPLTTAILNQAVTIHAILGHLPAALRERIAGQ